MNTLPVDRALSIYETLADRTAIKGTRERLSKHLMKIYLEGEKDTHRTAERWSEDVSEDVAEEIRRRCDLQMRELPVSISDFVEQHEDHDRRQLTLRLV
jgi:Mn-dependent DtxR family transcriptional regulator